MCRRIDLSQYHGTAHRRTCRERFPLSATQQQGLALSIHHQKRMYARGRRFAQSKSSNQQEMNTAKQNHVYMCITQNYIRYLVEWKPLPARIQPVLPPSGQSLGEAFQTISRQSLLHQPQNQQRKKLSIDLGIGRKLTLCRQNPNLNPRLMHNNVGMTHETPSLSRQDMCHEQQEYRVRRRYPKTNRSDVVAEPTPIFQHDQTFVK